MTLCDEDFNYINFNNINWSILFCLYITYRIPIQQVNRQINEKPEQSESDNPKINELNFLNS